MFCVQHLVCSLHQSDGAEYLVMRLNGMDVPVTQQERQQNSPVLS
jgi:hypothetical protein